MRNHALFAQRLKKRVVKLLHRPLAVHFVEAVGVLIEAAFEKIILEELEKVLGAQAFERIGDVFGIFDEFHFTPRRPSRRRLAQTCR